MSDNCLSVGVLFVMDLRLSGDTSSLSCFVFVSRWLLSLVVLQDMPMVFLLSISIMQGMFLLVIVVLGHPSHGCIGEFPCVV